LEEKKILCRDDGVLRTVQRVLVEVSFGGGKVVGLPVLLAVQNLWKYHQAKRLVVELEVKDPTSFLPNLLQVAFSTSSHYLSKSSRLPREFPRSKS
jgi:hypothetical protein